MPQKKFRLSSAEIRPLATGHGSCLASDRVVVGGEKVGYCYREQPDSTHDSGWRFLAGNETQDYLDNPANLGMYDVNTVANYDPEIIPLLISAAGSAFERNSSGVFVKVPAAL
jgi:hypothetical protein